MIGWLTWVGSALVLLSLLLDDRRSLRVVNLVAALGVLGASLTVGPASLVAVDAVIVALAVHHLVRRAPERPMVRIVDGPRASSLRAA